MLEKEKAIEKLNEKEIKVYQYILAHSLEFPFMTIRELADKVQVSTTVILNYVKKMGYKSFKEFKLAYRLQERKSRESKRIYDDKQVIGALIQLDNEYYQEKLHLAKVMIGNHNNLIFTGVGNSGLIGAYGARIFQVLENMPMLSMILLCVLMLQWKIRLLSLCLYQGKHLNYFVL